MQDSTSKARSTQQPPPVKEFMVLGDKMLVKQSAESTGGAYAVMEQFLKPGGGPPPHTHTREDEVFFVVAGQFDILLGDDTVRAKAGDVLNAPRNLRHTYHCVGEEPGTILFLTYPAGIEKFFSEAGQLGFPPDMSKLFQIAETYGLLFDPLPKPSSVATAPVR